MPQETKPTITVGIAAYNAEKNIGSLLQSMLAQESINFKLRKIIVHCDDCTDNTIEVIQSIKSEKIQIIDNKERKGFAGSVLALLEHSKQDDLVVLLNDDIKIEDLHFINKLIKPFQEDNKVGMVCANRDCLPPVNFVDKVGRSIHSIWLRVKDKINSTSHPHTVDGKAMVVSKELAQHILGENKDPKDFGNLDIYLFITCVSKGLKYYFVNDAVVWFRNPTTWKDFFGWHLRNFAQESIMEKTFGNEVYALFDRPKSYYRTALIKEFLVSPINTIVIIFQAVHLRFYKKKYAKNFSQKWEVISSTKGVE